MGTRHLTDEERERAAAILDNVLGFAKVELQEMAELLVSKPNDEFFGATEFLMRDALHRIGARVYDTALEERKKRGTADRASAARNAKPTSGSRTTPPPSPSTR